MQATLETARHDVPLVGEKATTATIVKLVALVAVPPGAVTLTLPVLVPAATGSMSAGGSSSAQIGDLRETIEHLPRDQVASGGRVVHTVGEAHQREFPADSQVRRVAVVGAGQ